MSKKNKYDYILYIILFTIIISFVTYIVYTIVTDNKNLNKNTEVPHVAPTPAPTPTPAPAPAKPQPQEVKKPETEIVKKEEVITTYETEILDSKGQRIHNIKLATEKLNNKTLAPGEVFSFNETVGKMGEAQGYKKADSFKSDGTKYQEFGGGICQVSSTLYNTVLDSGLEVVERHPHSRRVYYVPKDRDATIFYGHKDFKFKNSTDTTIKIAIESSDTNVKVTLIKIIEEEKPKTNA